MILQKVYFSEPINIGVEPLWEYESEELGDIELLTNGWVMLQETLLVSPSRVSHAFLHDEDEVGAEVQEAQEVVEVKEVEGEPESLPEDEGEVPEEDAEGTDEGSQISAPDPDFEDSQPPLTLTPPKAPKRPRRR